MQKKRGVTPGGEGGGPTTPRAPRTRGPEPFTSYVFLKSSGEARGGVCSPRGDTPPSDTLIINMYLWSCLDCTAPFFVGTQALRLLSVALKSPLRARARDSDGLRSVHHLRPGPWAWKTHSAKNASTVFSNKYSSPRAALSHGPFVAPFFALARS